MEELFGEPDIPDLYVDSARMALSAYGITIELGRQAVPDTPMSEQPPIIKLALVRMSPQHALVFAKLLQKNVNLYQERVGKIELPAELYRQLDIEPD